MDIIDNGEVPEQPFKTASQGTRFGNYMLDYFILYLVSLPINYLPFMVDGRLKMEEAVRDATASQDLMAIMNSSWEYLRITILIGFVLNGLYYILMEYYFGRTLGKMVTKTMVISTDGGGASLQAIIVRTLCRFIPLEPISFLFGSIGWHDRLSKTRVVMVDEPADDDVSY